MNHRVIQIANILARAREACHWRNRRRYSEYGHCIPKIFHIPPYFRLYFKYNDVVYIT